jgi:hypothetical protein
MPGTANPTTIDIRPTPSSREMTSATAPTSSEATICEAAKMTGAACDR